MLQTPKRGLDRRQFLRRGALAGLALAAGPAAAVESPGVRRYLTLGRTGLRVCDIGFGSAQLRREPGSERLVHHAIDRGINYFDTAEGYGDAEEILGHALRGKRSDLVLVTKAKFEANDRHGAMMETLEGSLRRLQTDYVDVHFNHAVNDVARVANPEWHEFTARAKQQGKIRFTGMSGHSGRLIDCVRHVVANDLVDVLLVAFNFGQDPAFYARILRRFDLVALQPELPAALLEAKQKGIGVVAMKTLRGAKKHDLSSYREDGASFDQAAFRWVLSHDSVDSLIVTMRSEARIDEFLGASGWTRSAAADARTLARYEAREGQRQCRYGCQACADACPAGVSIPDVLRTRMYAEDYGSLGLAKSDYGKLEVDAGACLSCSGEPCAGACPHGIPIGELTRRTGRLLG